MEWKSYTYTVEFDVVGRLEVLQNNLLTNFLTFGLKHRCNIALFPAAKNSEK
jgi:hypothetical protein